MSSCCIDSACDCSCTCGKYTFKNNREAFDFAVNALKKLLKEHGYERNGNNEWIK